jgi:hypothetical protein
LVARPILDSVPRVTDRQRESADELLKEFRHAISGMGRADPRQLAGSLLSIGPESEQLPKPQASRRRSRRRSAAMFRLRVDLEDAKPPIWRRLEMRSDLTLDRVHHVLQGAFGWTDSHLHRFALGSSVFDEDAEMFLCPFDVEDGDDDGVPAKDVRLDEVLGEPGDVLRYCYDYGDAWELAIVLESVEPWDASSPMAVCVDGRRAAPPEDCGSLRTAEALASVLPEPAHFDLDEINRELIDPLEQMRESGVHPLVVDVLLELRSTTIGDDLLLRVMVIAAQTAPRPALQERLAALHPMLWFLDRVGDDGLALTSAGYLKPDDVEALAEVLPDAREWIGKANRESATVPVLDFRRSLQQLGLVRRYRGRLLLTKLGRSVRGDPEELWRQIARRLPLGRPGTVESPAGVITLVLTASSAGEDRTRRSLAEALNELGWRDDDDPVSEASARWAARPTLNLLLSITTDQTPSWRRGISPVAVELARDAVLSAQP